VKSTIDSISNGALPLILKTFRGREIRLVSKIDTGSTTMKTRNIVLSVVLTQLLALTVAAQKVTVDHDKSVVFSKYRTYAWKEGTPAKNPLMATRIVQAIDNQMTLKGLTKVAGDRDPDLFIVYHAAVDYETQLNTVGMGYGWGYYGGTTTTYVDKIPIGTLLVEMGDPSSQKMVWRGQGTDDLSDKPEKIEKKINQIVEKLFKKFPPEQK